MAPRIRSQLGANDAVPRCGQRCYWWPRLPLQHKHKTIISRYYGRVGKDFEKTGSIFLASLDYERDIVPTLANFIPFALGMGEIVWRSDAPLQ
jgi:hypothetical protein